MPTNRILKIATIQNYNFISNSLFLKIKSLKICIDLLI